MSVTATLKKYIRKLLPIRISETDPEKAYDLWAAAYDAQPDNLMLALDEELFTELLNGVILKDKLVADIGCGTGRHWQKLMERAPAELIGFDVSNEMLIILQQKFPAQKTVRLTDHHIELPDASCDTIVSTLALAHIPDVGKALAEWERVLKPGAEILLTDYHPDALAQGGNRTFRHEGKLVAVKNYVHSIHSVVAFAKQLNLNVLRITERKIDEKVKGFYEKQNALAVYDKFKGVPIIYGIHLKKKHAPA
jgi:ubiquinone/menaquinone biosynthesis C-methylase UbiE